jgi:membrane-associated phospholipid phosphatase
MRNHLRCGVAAATVLFLMFCGAQMWGSEVISESTARSISSSLVPFMAAGQLSLLGDKHEFVQGAKALGAACLATELLKHTVKEKRPNTDSEVSFPSGHTACAFAMATTLANYKPEYKWPAYGLAAAIGFSRVEAGSHYWHDVIAGAVIGHYAAKYFTSDRVYVSGEGVGLKWKW